MASNYKNLLFEKTDTYSISNDSAFDTKLNESVYSGIIEDKPIFHSSQEHLHKLVPPTLISKTKLSPNSSISSINSSKISLPESKVANLANKELVRIDIEDKIDSASLSSASSDETDESVLEAILEKQQQTYNPIEKLKEANDKLAKIPLPKKVGSEGLKTITFSETISVRSKHSSSTSTSSSNSSIWSAEVPSSKSPTFLQKPIITIDQPSDSNSSYCSQVSLQKSNLEENIFSAADTTHSSLASLDESRCTSADKLEEYSPGKILNKVVDIEEKINNNEDDNRSGTPIDDKIIDKIFGASEKSLDNSNNSDSNNFDNKDDKVAESIKSSKNGKSNKIAASSDTCSRSISRSNSSSSLVEEDKQSKNSAEVNMDQSKDSIASIKSDSTIKEDNLTDISADEVESIKSSIHSSKSSSKSIKSEKQINQYNSIPKASDNQQGEILTDDSIHTEIEEPKQVKQSKPKKIKAHPPPGPKRSKSTLKGDSNEINVFDRLYQYSRCKSAPQIKEKPKGKYLWIDPDDQPKFVHELPNYMRPATSFSEKPKGKRFEIEFGKPSKFVRDHWKEIEINNPGIKSRYSMCDEQKKQEAKRNRLRAERLKAHEKLIKQQKEEDMQSCHEVWTAWYTNHVEEYREAERERIRKEKEKIRNKLEEEAINERETKKQVDSWKKSKLLQQRRELNSQNLIQAQLDAEKESEHDRQKRNNKAFKSWIKKVKKSEKEKIEMEKAMVKMMKIEMRREMRAKKALLVIRAAQEEALKYKGFVF